MKKFKVVVVAFIMSLLYVPFVQAECNATESNKLSSLATNVKRDFEVIEKEVPLDGTFTLPDGLTEEEEKNYVATRPYFRIYISNITEELYVVVTNNNTKEKKTFRYSDAENGVITFDEAVLIEIVDYKIEIYASDKTECPNKKLQTLTLSTPMYNTFSEEARCEGIEEFYLCHEYLSVETSFKDFDRLVEQYRAGKLKEDGSKKEENKNNGFFGFIKEHTGTVIIVSVAIIAIGGLVTVIIVKKQRSRVV